MDSIKNNNPIPGLVVILTTFLGWEAILSLAHFSLDWPKGPFKYDFSAISNADDHSKCEFRSN